MRARYQIDPALVKLAADFNPLRGIADAIDGMEKQKAENVYRNALMRRMEVESHLGYLNQERATKEAELKAQESQAKREETRANTSYLHAKTKAQAIENAHAPAKFKNALENDRHARAIAQQNADTASQNAGNAFLHNVAMEEIAKAKEKREREKHGAEIEAIKQNLKGAYQ